jgi:hypothetical protein
MVMEEAREGAVSLASSWPIPKFRADFPYFGLKIVEHSRYLLLPHFNGSGKLDEYSDNLGSMIGNQAEYSDKTENGRADAASKAEASMQWMEMGNGIFYHEKCCIARNTSGSGNLSEPSSNCFLDEYSDKRPSAQHLRPTIHPIYQIWLNVRQNQPQSSNVLAQGSIKPDGK